MKQQRRKDINRNQVYKYAPQLFPSLPPELSRRLVLRGIFDGEEASAATDVALLSIHGIGQQKLDIIRNVYPYNPESTALDNKRRTWADVENLIFDIAAIECKGCGGMFVPYPDGVQVYCKNSCRKQHKPD